MLSMYSCMVGGKSSLGWGSLTVLFDDSFDTFEFDLKFCGFVSLYGAYFMLFIIYSTTDSCIKVVNLDGNCGRT